MTEFLQNYGLEAFGTLASLIYLYYSIREKVWCWPWGLIASVTSMLVFYFSRLYADMGLQVYYVTVSIYGWYYWMNGQSLNQTDKQIPISSTNPPLLLKLSVISFVLYGLILFLLMYVPDWLQIEPSAMPYLDAFTTATSIVATWMLARKLIEHWLLWIGIDILSMSMYLYKGLYLFAFLYLVYTIGAIVGYIEWKKHNLQQAVQ
jgi:nicotinamide mononucleotide transporter